MSICANYLTLIGNLNERHRFVTNETETSGIVFSNSDTQVCSNINLLIHDDSKTMYRFTTVLNPLDTCMITQISLEYQFDCICLEYANMLVCFIGEVLYNGSDIQTWEKNVSQMISFDTDTYKYVYDDYIPMNFVDLLEYCVE